jgi:hypothetical protein
MTPAVLIALLVAVSAVALILAVRRPSRLGTFDLGAVSTRWLSELRRDEPWTR